MKKISIIILFAIFFIGCSSNDYKQNSISMSELNNIPDKVILNIEPQYQTTNYTCALLVVGYDKDNQTIYINDPSNIVTEFSYEELNKRWNAWLYRPRFHSEQSGFILIKE